MARCKFETKLTTTATRTDNVLLPSLSSLLSLALALSALCSRRLFLTISKVVSRCLSGAAGASHLPWLRLFLFTSGPRNLLSCLIRPPAPRPSAPQFQPLQPYLTKKKYKKIEPERTSNLLISLNVFFCCFFCL